MLDNVQERGGLGGVTVAAAYHDGRDVFPHNPVRKVRFLESGAVFFPPGPALRDVRLQPPVSAAATCCPRPSRRRAARPGRPRVDGVPPQRRACRGASRVRARERVRRPLRDRAVPGESGCPRLRARARRRHRGARCCGHLLRGAALPRPRARLRARALFRPARSARPLSARAVLLRALSRCRACAGVDGDAARRSAREAIERAFARRRPWRRSRARRIRGRPRASRDVAGRRGRRGGRRDAVRVHRALGRGQGLRGRQAHRRSGALDRLAARCRRRRRRRRLRRDRGDRLRRRPGARSAATSTPTATPRSPSSSARRPPTATRPRTCAPRSSWPAPAIYVASTSTTTA